MYRKMNTLTLMWIVFIIITTLIDETVQKLTLTEINDEPQYHYIDNYTEKNISIYGCDVNENKSVCDNKNNSDIQSKHIVTKTVLILLLFLIIGMLIVFTYLIVRQSIKKRVTVHPSDNANVVPNTYISEQFQSYKPLRIRHQRHLSPSSRERRTRRSFESEELEMRDLDFSLEEERESKITRQGRERDIHTEMQHQDRSSEQSQSTTFVTHTIIEKESISESDPQSQGN